MIPPKSATAARAKTKSATSTLPAAAKRSPTRANAMPAPKAAIVPAREGRSTSGSVAGSSVDCLRAAHGCRLAQSSDTVGAYSRSSSGLERTKSAVARLQAMGTS